MQSEITSQIIQVCHGHLSLKHVDKRVTPIIKVKYFVVSLHLDISVFY